MRHDGSGWTPPTSTTTSPMTGSPRCRPTGGTRPRLLVVDPGRRPPGRGWWTPGSAILGAHLDAGDRLVVNATRVIPARVEGRRLREEGQDPGQGGGRVGLTFLDPGVDGSAWALARSSRPLRPGARVELPGGVRIEVVERGDFGRVRVRVVSGDLDRALEEAGRMPLPPYIPPRGRLRPGPGGPGPVPDDLRPGARGGGGAHRGPPLHARAPHRPPVPGHRADRDLPPRGLRELRAGAGRAGRGPPAAPGALRGRGRGGGADPGDPGRGAPDRRRGHDLRPLARDRGGVGHDPAGGGVGRTSWCFPATRSGPSTPSSPTSTSPGPPCWPWSSHSAGRTRIRAAYAHALASGYRFLSYGDAMLIR